MSQLSSTPRVTCMQVIPVAGQDSMLLNLSVAHGPFLTRSIVILTDSAGNTGLGEVPGGERIRQTLEDARSLMVGKTIGEINNILNAMQQAFADRDSSGRGLQNFDPRITIHTVTAIESALLDLLGQRLTKEPLTIEGGLIRVPDRPGLGIEIDMVEGDKAHQACKAMGLGARDDPVAMHFLIPGWKFDSDSNRPCLVR